MNPIPPTLYSILNSIANYDATEKTKIRDLAKVTHDKVFDFDYTLSEAINKDEFEIEILNHYMMRRIGFETFTSFQLYLENKLKEILPYYNLMLDAFKDYNLFNNGEVINRIKNDTRNTTGTSGSNGENRLSEYPLNELDDLTDGKYVTSQNTSNIAANNTTNDVGSENERIERSPVDKMSIYKSYLETRRSVMSMIYKELDILFYGLTD
jgi:hypothetical protein